MRTAASIGIAAALVAGLVGWSLAVERGGPFRQTVSGTLWTGVVQWTPPGYGLPEDLSPAADPTRCAPWAMPTPDEADIARWKQMQSNAGNDHKRALEARDADPDNADRSRVDKDDAIARCNRLQGVIEQAQRGPRGRGRRSFGQLGTHLGVGATRGVPTSRSLTGTGA